MATEETAASPKQAGRTTNALRERLRRIEAQDWWLWSATVITTLLLTMAVVSFAVPNLLPDGDGFFRFHLNQSVRGLVGLVLLFNTYTIYQRIQIGRLRRRLAGQLELAAQLEMRADEFQRLSVRDPLTGLYNRRFAEERLVAEITRAQRYHHPLSVLMIDLDDFKQINDRYGHAAGDDVLQGFAEQLQRATRGSDLPTRLGGDEFLVLLPECASDQVRCLLERLHPFAVEWHGQRIPVSVSVGWAGYIPGESPQELLRRADEALYAKKRACRRSDPEMATAAAD